MRGRERKREKESFFVLLKVEWKIVCSVSLDISLASFREVLLFVGNRKMSTVRSRGSSVMKVSRGVGVDHHSRLDITQLFIAQTSVELRCFSLKLFDDSQAGAIYDGIAAAVACLSRQLVKLKQRARENRRDLETARGSS